MANVVIKNLKKTYGSVVAVNGLNLEIRDGELVAFLGPSGCGKTTTLRIIAGLIEEDEGEVFVDGTSMKGVPPWKRNTGFVFQNYALFPHLTAYENIAYGLNTRKWEQERIYKQVYKVAELVQITSLLNRYPRQLSGGQQQRVALARALAVNPKLLLMDEPLSGLDAKLREKVQYELKRMQRESNITTIYVTHDQGEAFALADRVVVMNEGRIEQEGSPEYIYSNPQSNFVATFIGRSNIIDGIIDEVDVNSEIVVIKCGDLILRGRLKLGFTEGDNVEVIIRNNKIKLNLTRDMNFINVFEGKVLDMVFNELFWKVNIEIGGCEINVDIADYNTVGNLLSCLNSKNSKIFVGISENDVLYFKKK